MMRRLSHDPRLVRRSWITIIITACLFGFCISPTNSQTVSTTPESSLPSADDNGWLAKAIDLAQSRTVKVYGAGAGRVNSYASGIIVSPDGHVLTMQGVFLDGDQVRVGLPNGEIAIASVLRRDRQFQLALLKIPQATPEYFELSSEPVGEKGDWVVALSNAFMVAEREEPLSATLGVISLPTSIEARINREVIAYRGDLVLIDCITSNPGAGGGAVVLTDGRLVGMIGKIINSSDTNTRLNYAVPSRVLKNFLEGQSLAEAQTSSIAEPSPANLGLALFQHGGKGGPAYIDRVTPQGPGAAAGLKPDDLIVSIGGEKIGTVRDYDRILPTLAAGSEVIVVVKRGAELLRLPVTPAAEK